MRRQQFDVITNLNPRIDYMNGVIEARADRNDYYYYRPLDYYDYGINKIMRVSYIDITVAFQATEEGLIPSTRSKFKRIHMRIRPQGYLWVLPDTEIIQAKDLCRPLYSNSDYAIGDQTTSGYEMDWQRCDMLIPGWIGYTLKDCKEFRDKMDFCDLDYEIVREVKSI